MKYLIISQVFWPDTSAVSQVLTDFALALSARGDFVKVLASSSAYENPETIFPRWETYRRIKITRLRQSHFAKKSPLGRAFNFFTFLSSLAIRLLGIPRKEMDFVIGTSVPPMGAFFGALSARLKRKAFVFWEMDLQPELSIAAGYMKSGGGAARILRAMSALMYRMSSRIIVLDKYMARYVQRKIGASTPVRAIPVWPVPEALYLGPRRENAFRITSRFGDKIVVMYSGNHSVMHPLDTLLEAALLLRNDARFIFVFVGGGVRKADVEKFRSEHALENIVSFPLQPRSSIHLSLAAADIHAVVMGNGIVGFTHPSKIYGAMALGKPILYVGPTPSHISDLLAACPGNLSFEHRQPRALADALDRFAQAGETNWADIGRRNAEYIRQNISKERMIGEMFKTIDSIPL